MFYFCIGQNNFSISDSNRTLYGLGFQLAKTYSMLGSSSFIFNTISISLLAIYG